MGEPLTQTAIAQGARTRGADGPSPGATTADTSVQTSELIRCQARCRTGPSDSGTNMAQQSSTGRLPDGEKLLMHSAGCMHHISMYIHWAHLGHTMLGHPLAHMGCLRLLHKGWCGSRLAPLQSPQHWPAPRNVARSSNGPLQPTELGWMGSLSAPHRGNCPSP